MIFLFNFTVVLNVLEHGFPQGAQILKIGSSRVPFLKLQEPPGFFRGSQISLLRGTQKFKKVRHVSRYRGVLGPPGLLLGVQDIFFQGESTA